jgi:hypothetical protein
MADPKFSLKMRTSQEEKEGDVQLKAGTTLEVEVEDWGSSAGIDVDYTSAESITVIVNGKVGLKGLRLDGAKITGSLNHDFITRKNTIDGKLELTFPKDVSVSVNTKLAPGDRSVGAVLTIKL